MDTQSIPLLKVLAPGPMTTVQDQGRYGFQKFGVPVSGVMDVFSTSMANLLVGNDEQAAVLECTIVGPTLLILDHCLVAVTGAQMPVTLNGEATPGWSSLRVKAGDIVEIGPVQSGCRGYIAVTGGIEVPLIMGSRSTHTGAGFGGLHGRALQKEDILCRGAGELLPTTRQLPGMLTPKFPDRILLRAIAGPQDDYFDNDLATFFDAEFEVSHEASRAGYRLRGPVIRQKAGKPASIISESSTPGAVQIPPNGQPIILLKEQTVGGYTKIATVISSDLDMLGQAIPGTGIRFQRIDLETAVAIKRKKKRLLEQIQTIIALTDDAQDLQRRCAAAYEDANR